MSSEKSTTTGVTVRLVRPEEYDAAGNVTAQAYSSSYQNLSEDYLASLRDVRSRLQLGDVWVAVDDSDDILGTVWVAPPGKPLSPVAREGETDFRQLAVAPHARGRGIGELLTRHVIAIARERGSRGVMMNSGPEMTGAHALYAKLGFRRDPEREGEREVAPGRIVNLMTFTIDI